MRDCVPGQSPVWTGDDLSEQEFAEIMILLRDRRQFRLDNYKDRCIRRRIAKRLRAVGAEDVSGYLGRLRTDDDELDALLSTLSIHVSRFFRNPDTFQVLEREILPDLCQRARAEGRKQLRLWSVGCAAGEEPYSLALLVDEMGLEGLQVDILGTDVSEPVLATARQGIYDRNRLSEVPASVLQKYFQEDAGSYRLTSRIRDKVHFERHNIMTAESFPPADLILCRNVLIYFSRAEQERILACFHEVLSEYGVLVLGRSEVLVGKMRSLYQSEFSTERIYRRMMPVT
ncbi:MAG: protein-glutamate O-methyltransferase CheR [Desulfuromonadales bacterium]|jgi:chemotaxis protein methyltransferase CheR|nr:protein-glutamate O-methyltransferase CheR [Desulfuromonadales bacterium]